MTWHQTIVVGNLGGDPELRYLQSGDAVCNFSVAATDSWRDRQSGERRERTTWYRVAVWGPQAESCNTYLSKGRRVLVTGNVSARGYINNNGEAAASLDLRARDVRFLSSRSEDGGDQGGGWSGGGQQSGGGGQRGGGQQSQRRDDRASNYPDSPGSVDDIPF
ncbi:MAG: single-stranded DNA-binding protein [Chloroflexi bacterium]|nr:single-stranded DNA-binding protein [Chloroflexota bacterium]